MGHHSTVKARGSRAGLTEKKEGIYRNEFLETRRPPTKVIVRYSSPAWRTKEPAGSYSIELPLMAASGVAHTDYQLAIRAVSPRGGTVSCGITTST